MSPFCRTKRGKFELEATNAYMRGFRDGRLCPSRRPCVADGKPAVFHRWIEKDKVLLKAEALIRPKDMEIAKKYFENTGIIAPSCSGEKIRNTYALVEYEDGSVGLIEPTLIKFIVKEAER